MPILAKAAVALYDINSRAIVADLSRHDAEHSLAVFRTIGDTVQEYDTTDRGGRPCRVALHIAMPGDPGGVYLITL